MLGRSVQKEPFQKSIYAPPPHTLKRFLRMPASYAPWGGGGAPTPSLGIDCETDPESGSSDWSSGTSLKGYP